MCVGFFLVLDCQTVTLRCKRIAQVVVALGEPVQAYLKKAVPELSLLHLPHPQAFVDLRLWKAVGDETWEEAVETFLSIYDHLQLEELERYHVECVLALYRVDPATRKAVSFHATCRAWKRNMCTSSKSKG